MMIKKKPQIKVLENRIKELEEGWKRSQADFENYKKRQEDARGEILNLLKADFLTKITPVLDNFRRAFEHAPDNEFATGIKQIEKQLEDILVNEGLERISAQKGAKFDHNFHEAISYEENSLSADHIIGETESGWKIGSRVLKPAKVRVSKGK